MGELKDAFGNIVGLAEKVVGLVGKALSHPLQVDHGVDGEISGSWLLAM